MLRTTRVFDGIAANHKKRYTILQGSSSSSKTYSILQYLIVLASSVQKRLLISVVGETLPALKRGALKDFIDILGSGYDEKYHNKSERTYRLGQCTFEFFSADQHRKLKGPRRDILYINEANNVSYEAYTQLEIRTRKKIFLDYNPTQEFWVHTELLPKVPEEDLYFAVSTYRDNPYVKKAVVEGIERRKYGPDGEITEWYKVYGLGELGALDGVIYDNWEQIESFPTQEYDTRFGLDFGYTNDPTALIKVAHHNLDLYVDEYLYERGLTNQDLIFRFAEYGIEQQIIYADPAEPKSIEELVRGGYIVKPAIKGAGSVSAGIDWIQGRKIWVTKRSLNVIKELRNYVWEKDRDGKPTNHPIDAWDHSMDALRYALSHKLQRIGTARWARVII